ncbi:MAG TPA: bifunctional methylenetetrahydrofolate dehydrogenase/methenyltetrahydrofolate cyclohydrolase FolD [Cytophagales bacterium]|jgi:methylenetetrahydrofolate dehydrogenase (NADP+)/methenyltetrahydrofolate cyclohydrolase|nr:bifunctional methylenetetrahydrofolate dehydrogenase/methenyltetrahydrofolate cyclohydrolase FolD [Cytophagales bacterium]
MATQIDGKATSLKIQEELAEQVEKIKKEGGKIPHLAAVLVGDDGASLTYVNAKVKACERIGYGSTLVHLPEVTTEEALLEKVKELNENDDIDGFIVQVPLPDHIDEQKVVEAISPKKDVDGFHPINMGNMLLGLPGFVPATPKGIMMLLERYDIETSGKHCVVMGRSHTVGTPVSILMSRKATPGNATVTVVHSRTKDIPSITRQADILIVALGQREFVTADMVKEGAVVVDVGIHRVPAPEKKSGFRLRGDVKFDEVAEKASFITPVPGGVGPMTIAALLYNTMLAAKNEK